MLPRHITCHLNIHNLWYSIIKENVKSFGIQNLISNFDTSSIALSKKNWVIELFTM